MLCSTGEAVGASPKCLSPHSVVPRDVPAAAPIYQPVPRGLDARKTFPNLSLPAISATKARILCALGGLVCVVLVSAFIVPHPENMQGSTVPQLIWHRLPFDACGEDCYVVGCLGPCTTFHVLAGEKCCDPGANEYVFCLYGGP